MIKVSAPAKIIISGEHSVVYGEPALVTSLDKRLTLYLWETKTKQEITSFKKDSLVFYGMAKAQEILGKKVSNLNLKIKSEIPVSRGLGSSAALSVALAAGLSFLLTKKKDKKLINQIAYEIEKKQHGKPSGCDNSIATYGGTIIFQKGEIKPIKINSKFNFLLVDSGRAVESTREMVENVSEKLKTQSVKRKNIKEIGEITLKIIETLKANTLKNLKPLISENERLLEELGVVGKRAKEIVRGLEKIGGAGKICGAGGLKKGSGMILGFHQDPKILKSWLLKNNRKFLKVKIHQEGVRIEED